MHKVAGIASVLTGDGDKAKGEWKLLELSASLWHRRLTLRASNTPFSSYSCKSMADATSPHIFFSLEKSSCPSQVESFGSYVPQSCIKFCSIGNILFYSVSGILLWSPLMYHTRFHDYILEVYKFTELSVTFLTLTLLLSCNSRHCSRLCLAHEVDVTETR